MRKRAVLRIPLANSGAVCDAINNVFPFWISQPAVRDEGLVYHCSADLQILRYWCNWDNRSRPNVVNVLLGYYSVDRLLAFDTDLQLRE